MRSFEHIEGVPEAASEPAEAPITLAEVIARLEADQDLSARRRKSMIAAVRTVCRVLDADPASVLAQPGTLGQKLAAISPPAEGFGRAHWTNIRSLTFNALRHAGVRTMHARWRKPLTPEWEDLYGRLVDRELHLGLSRFIGFCSAQGVSPGAVSRETFESFREALLNGTSVRRPLYVHRKTCLLWNRAADSIAGWPQGRAVVSTLKRRYALAWQEFPESFRRDVDAYLDRLVERNPFDDDYARPIRPSTAQLRRKQLLQIATALVLKGVPAETVTSLSALVEPENAKLALRFFYDRAGGKSTTRIHGMAILLRSIARHWVKPANTEAIAALDKRVAGLAVPKGQGLVDKNKDILRQFYDRRNVDVLLCLPERILQEAPTENIQRRDALRVMLGLTIELLITSAIRIDNLTELREEEHLVKSRMGPEAAVHLVLPGDITKNHDPHELRLPEASAAYLRRYLSTYRPLIATRPAPWLFPNENGERRSTIAFSRAISDFIRQETGIKMHVHFFRQLAVFLHLERHPDDLETARRILGHRSLATTLAAYAELKRAWAFRKYEGMIAERRGEAQPASKKGVRARRRRAIA